MLPIARALRRLLSGEAKLARRLRVAIGTVRANEPALRWLLRLAASSIVLAVLLCPRARLGRALVAVGILVVTFAVALRVDDDDDSGGPACGGGAARGWT